LTDEDFKTHVDSLLLNKIEEPKNMASQCNRYWKEIKIQQYNFNRSWSLFQLNSFFLNFEYNFLILKGKIEAEELKKLNKNDLLEFYDVSF